MSSTFLFRRVLQQCASRSPVIIISTRWSSSSTENQTSASLDPEFKKKIDDFIKSNKIAIFIKGEPSAPRRMKKHLFLDLRELLFLKTKLGCGFSNAVLQILNLHGCDFKSKNILEDEQLRQNMKNYR